MSGGKKRVPRPVRSPLVTLAKSTPVGGDEAAEIMMPFDAVRDKPRRSGRGRIARTAQPSFGI